MPSNQLAELLEQTAAHLRDDHRVDVGLEEIASAIHASAGVDAKALDRIKRRLSERRKAVAAAHDNLKRLLAAVSELEQILPLTPLGWQPRRDELTAQLARDEAAGLCSWLSDWFAGAADARLGALERLAEFALPDGMGTLAQRMHVAAQALGEREWALAAPVLDAGASGITIGEQVVPDEDVRRRLRRSLARLAVASAPESEVPRQLELLEEVGPGALHEALLARAARLADDVDAAAHYVDNAYTESPTMLDVAVEWVMHVRKQGARTAGLESARAAVDAMPSLVDVDARLARLLIGVPAEVWVAVAERAAREGDATLADQALDAADDAAWEDAELRATIAEERVAVLASAAAPERVAALVEAGDRRSMVGQPQVAAQHYQAALELAPENDDGALGLADCLVVNSATEPAAASRELLEKALELCQRVRDRDGRTFNDEHAWGYAVEAQAHLLLATTPTPDRDDHLWQAILTSARGVARSPDTWQRWDQIGGCATALDLFATALVFSQHAAALGAAAGDLDANDTLIMALSNVGRFDEALAHLPQQSEPWHEAIRGYILALTGHSDEALAILDTTPIEPFWTWARHILLLLRFNAGQSSAATRDATGILAELGQPADPSVSRNAVSAALLVLGRIDEALALARDDPLSDRAADTNHAAALLLAGRDSEGLRHLREELAQASVGDLMCWQRLERPAIERLAEELDIELPDLDAVNDVIAARRQELSVAADPVTEVDETDAGEAQSALAARARSATAALVHVARDDLDGLRSRFEHDPALGSDPDFAHLPAYVEDQISRARAHDVVRDVLSTLTEPEPESEPERQPDGGRAILRRLLEIDAGTAASELYRLGGSEAVDVVLRALDRSAGADLGDADDVTQLIAVLNAYAGTTQPMASDLRLELPPSWFEGYEYPVIEHPLFTHHLPQARATASFEVPGIRVSVDEALEPDGYRITELDALIAQGHADPQLRWAEPEAMRWLPAALQPLAQVDADRGGRWVTLPAEAVDASGALGQLLTLSALEIITRTLVERIANADGAAGAAARVLPA